MFNILKYYDFVNETNLTDEKIGYNLELNEKGKKMLPFSNYFEDENNFIILKYIDFDEFEPINNKITLLLNTTFIDNIQSNKRDEYLIDIDFNENDYYFYQVYNTTINYDIDRITKSIIFNENPDRFEPQMNNGKKHFVIIKKNSNITTVKINSFSRYFSGDRAEKIIANKFNMRLEKTKMRKSLIQKTFNDGILDGYKDAILEDILKVDIETYRNCKDLFDLKRIDDPLNKYDLVILNGIDAGQKIEVKKYSINELFYKNKYSKEILIAEQFKISNKNGLKKLIKLYGESKNIDVELLYNKSETEINNYFNKDYNGQFKNLINDIRNFYNEKMNILKERYDQIPNELIMNELYGIYFFNENSGLDGFLIKNKNLNIIYFWKILYKQWGLARISLVANINPKAKRYVWLGDENLFIETYEVGNIDIAPSKISDIIEDTIVGDIKWNESKGYWVKLKNKENKKRTLSIKKIKEIKND